MIDPGEECDDGNDVAGDGCTNCVVDCTGFKDPTSYHCYVLSLTATKKWSAASTACQMNGGYLAAITSAEELAFVAGNVTAPVWIGGNDLVTDLVFQWSDGEPWSFAPWLPGAPGAANNGLNCVSLQGSPTMMGFQDIGCNSKQAYLCENSPIGK